MKEKYITMSLNEYEQIKEQYEKLIKLLSWVFFDEEHPIDEKCKSEIQRYNNYFGWWL